MIFSPAKLNSWCHNLIYNSSATHHISDWLIQLFKRSVKRRASWVTSWRKFMRGGRWTCPSNNNNNSASRSSVLSSCALESRSGARGHLLLWVTSSTRHRSRARHINFISTTSTSVYIGISMQAAAAWDVAKVLSNGFITPSALHNTIRTIGLSHAHRTIALSNFRWSEIAHFVWSI